MTGSPVCFAVLMAFQFVQSGPLVDGELELVAPDPKWVDALLSACAHPLSADDPSAASTTRQRVTEFLKSAPRGQQPAESGFGNVPAYHFWMKLNRVTASQNLGRPMPRWGDARPPVEIAGGISLRVGYNSNLELYAGHIGYGVYPPARGHHYAERACRLIFSVARAHAMRKIWITCNPDNWASRRTCERLGGQLAGIVAVPKDHPLYLRGELEKCRYWVDV